MYYEKCNTFAFSAESQKQQRVLVILSVRKGEKGKLKNPYYSDVNFKTIYIKYIKIPDVRTFLDKSRPVRTRKRSGMSKNNPGMVRSPLSLTNSQCIFSTK